MNSPNAKRINLGFATALGIIAGYFTIQLLGLDLANWEDVYNGTPSSTLGNPNYVSSSLAILSTPIISLLFYRTRLRYWGKLGAITILGGVYSLILETQSVQGLAILVICIVAIMLIRLNEALNHRFNAILKAVSIISIGSIPLVTLLIAFGFPIQGGGATFIARSEYWRAAMNLILSNPLFGKGFDSFGDWYNFYRDQKAVDRSLGLFTDSTHNLFLELGVFGGAPLLITYIAIQAFALRRALTIITSSGNAHGKALVVAWFGFQIQSAISPSSLALLLLGFFLTGVVYRTGSNLERELVQKRNQEPFKRQGMNVKTFSKIVTILTGTGIAVAGIYLGAVPIVKDAQFRDAIEQGDGGKMIEVSRQWPFVYQQSRATAMTLKQNGYDPLAIQLAREIPDENPFNGRGWSLVFEYSNSLAERTKALSKMRKLDPLNPNLRTLAP